MGRRLARLTACGMTLAAGLAMAGCGMFGQPGNGGSSAPPNTVAQGFKIGLLLPDSTTARYEKFDRPLITQSIAALCPKCQVVYYNADHDASMQQRQFDAALDVDVQVIILDPVDAKAIAPMVSRAHDEDVPIVAYDRLARGPINAYTSFDNIQVGKMQGQALLDAISTGGDPERGPIVMLNGSPLDPNASDFAKGARSVLNGRVVIGKEYDVPNWSPEQARLDAVDAFTALGAAKVIGVYAANDSLAGGAAEAMRDTGVRKGTPLTGQDAELTAIQRILLGTQTMTVYKPIKSEAENAAEMAIDLGTGKKVKGSGSGSGTVDNGTSSSIPARIVQPAVVTRENIKETVVKDGFWKVQDICVASVQAACKAAGLS
ncbi:sugar ABC transporter substrate-binding protein [Streptosporangium sp. NPDC087985]|uniref:sugar ABC transporter substrate-binding protein n=1 Tax=Streptosporangium sp. NPDC087985 TaxID=3366196 RepID=UPI003822E050